MPANGQQQGSTVSGVGVFGLACIAAAIVGGGLKWAGIEIPLVGSPLRQVGLGLFGVLLVGVSVYSSRARSVRERITFSISEDLSPEDLIHARTLVYMDGKIVATLYTTKDRPYHTATASLPAPGSYGYRLERTQTRLVRVYRDRELTQFVGTETRKAHYRGTGTVDVDRGSVFTIVGLFKDDPEMKLMLRPVLAQPVILPPD